jgi:hypothetical protein
VTVDAPQSRAGLRQLRRIDRYQGGGSSIVTQHAPASGAFPGAPCPSYLTARGAARPNSQPPGVTSFDPDYNGYRCRGGSAAGVPGGDQGGEHAGQELGVVAGRVDEGAGIGLADEVEAGDAFAD